MASTTNVYTLKINIRAQEERERKEKERQTRQAIYKIQPASGPPQLPRKRMGLQFHEPGYYVAQGDQLRKKARLEELHRRVAERAAKIGIADAAKLASITTTKEVIDSNTEATRKEEDIPEVEWWDKILLRNKPLELILKLQEDGAKPEEIFSEITNLVEHPAIKKPPGQDNSTVQMPVFLTQKERKKIRRQNRKIAELEKQEQIKLGLLPKPEPKLKQSNIRFALGDEAIINPSMTDQMVREQEEKRKLAHIEHNESKKLTAEEKKQKKLRKVREDLNKTGIWVSVFRILDMKSQAHKFKVTQNAKQLTMTGVLLLYSDINLVVVEGGPKQQRKFKHLMMDRIRWSEDSLPEIQNTSSEVEPPRHNQCFLVWEGQVPQASFRGFEVKQMKSEPEARAYFRSLHLEHYWDLAFKMSVLESIKEA